MAGLSQKAASVDFSAIGGRECNCCQPFGDAMVTQDDCEDKPSAFCYHSIVLMEISLRDNNAKLSFVETFLIPPLLVIHLSPFWDWKVLC